MKQVKLAEKFVFSLLLASLAIYGVYQYTSGDTASVVLGTILVAVSLKEILK